MYDPTSSFEGASPEQTRALEKRFGTLASFIPYEELEEEAPWDRDAYEYLVEHPWLILPDTVPFHICTQHPDRVLKTGHLPADFTCPRRVPRCPWRVLLRRYGPLRLRPQCGPRASATRP